MDFSVFRAFGAKLQNFIYNAPTKPIAELINDYFYLVTRFYINQKKISLPPTGTFLYISVFEDSVIKYIIGNVL